MTTLRARAACISLVGLLVTTAIPGLQAQNASGHCGILTWSQSDQKHSVLPCTGPTPQSADGKPTCGIATWSQIVPRYVV